MNQKVKVGLYILFGLGALIFALLFKSEFSRLHAVQPDAGSTRNAQAGSAKQEVGAPGIVSTNGAGGLTKLGTGANRSGTNMAAAVGSNDPTSSSSSGDESVSTNVATAMGLTRTPGKNYSKLISYIGGFVLMAICLGLVTAWDVSQFMGGRAVNFLYNDDAKNVKDPEYDESEAVWADGRFLEAIGMLREYLKKNPREIHAAIRIAEIYEKDLQNPLAAALEYEEVLKHKLSAEKWGWSAIHLCNLYFKLNQETKAVDLLNKIDREYGKTSAAEKARKRLIQMGLPTTFDEQAVEEQENTPSAAPVPESPSTSTKQGKLPPGFTKK